jgi:hypothetical protein
MTAIKVLAFLLLGVGAFLVYGARFVAVKLDKGNEDSETDGHEGVPEQHASAPEVTGTPTEDEEKIMQKIPSRAILKVKMIGMIFILAGGILVLIVFK